MTKIEEIRDVVNIESKRWGKLADYNIKSMKYLLSEIDRLNAENASLKQQLAETNERLATAISDINSYGATCLICKKSKECDHEPEDGCFEYKGLQGKDEK